MNRLRLFLALLVIVALTVSTVGCGGDDDATPTPTGGAAWARRASLRGAAKRHCRVIPPMPFTPRRRSAR